jgi:hypothetical protein
MPGIYCGFAVTTDGGMALLQEGLTTTALTYVYIWCFDIVETNPYAAPLAVGIHGLVDFLHHFKLYPTEKHVEACSHNYPLLCGVFDFSFAATMATMIYMWGGK